VTLAAPKLLAKLALCKVRRIARRGFPGSNWEKSSRTRKPIRTLCTKFVLMLEPHGI
jgi:hypothetical protein